MDGYQLFTNAIGGRTLVIPPGCDLESIPTKYRSKIPADYVECFRSPSQTLGKLVDQCDSDSIRRWLKAVMEVPLGISIHGADRSEPDAGVVATLKGFPIQFRLPDDRTLYAPAGTESLYHTTDGTIESNDAFCTSGWLPSSHGGMDWRSVSPNFPEEFMDACDVYMTDRGDHLITLDGKIYSFMSGDDEIMEQGDTAQVVDDYFDAMMALKQWHPFPY